MAVVVCASYTGIGMIAPVRVLFAQSHGASLAVIGAMASAFLLANFIAQYPAGILADRIGRKAIIIAGLTIQAALTMSYLAISDPGLFILLRLCEGFAAALVLPSARALVADAVDEGQRGQAYGIFSAFFNGGFLLGPALGGFLAVLGYTPVFIVAAALRAAAILLALVVIRADSPGTSGRREAPSLQFLFNPALRGAYILAFGDYLYFGFDQTLMPLWIRNNLGAPIVAIGLVAMLWTIPIILLSPLTGRLADRMRRSTLIIIFGLAQVPLFVAVGLASSFLVVAILIPIHGCIYTLVQPAVDAHIAYSAPKESRARVQSMYSAIGLIGAFVGANAFSPIYALNWHLPLPVEGVIFGICVIIGGEMIRRSEKRTH